ncbi:hypothetical protein MCC93_15380 [Morococcus cerebrosus]|uniref:Uncharacterized protein n=1 Tax=Morococcus cerebrosus TaxID=1056807 RepID=A0A0C1GNU6_9NEIS|nr:hypothetical protein MCC93_15380 [Morococcus cerebrosus]
MFENLLVIALSAMKCLLSNYCKYFIFYYILNEYLKYKHNIHIN